MKKTERPIITFPNGQTVCPLGQGTWKMGQSAARRHEEIRALQHGIELGMNLVDTAEMYDNEELVGEAVRDCREKVLLVSKVLPSNASYRGTKLACERSLLKLGTEYIDLYLLHWKGRHPYEETVRAMTELQQEVHWWKSPGDTMYRLHKSHCRGRCVSPVSLPYPKPVM